MADYTYATSSGKTYDEFIKDSQMRAQAQSEEYTKRANAANEAYKTGINSIYDNSIKAQEERAAADTEKTYNSYNTQFDANAANQLARERHLKEQMANYGLGQSGYNATNQTALAVSRSNADAATRTARGQAVDAIAQELRDYRAQAENERAAALAESDRDTAQRIMDTEQSLLSGAHDEAMDRMNYDLGVDKFTWQRETDQRDYDYQLERDKTSDDQWQKEYDYRLERDKTSDDQWQKEYDYRLERDKTSDDQWQKEYDYRLERDKVADDQWQKQFDQTVKQNALDNEMSLKEYVDEHNNDIYSLMLEAYNDGNVALAEEYAKTLWQIDENGVVAPMTFDTTDASKYTEEQNALEKQLQQQKAAGSSSTGKDADEDEKKTGYDEFGFSRKYSDYIQEARNAALAAAQSKNTAVQQAYSDRALALMYLVEKKTQTEGSEGYMDSDTFKKLLRYVGLTEMEYNQYVMQADKKLSEPDAESGKAIRNPLTLQKGQIVLMDR